MKPSPKGFDVDAIGKRTGAPGLANVLQEEITKAGPLARFDAIPTTLDALTAQVNELRAIGGQIVYEIARRLQYAHENQLPKKSGMTWEEWVEAHCGIKRQTAYAYMGALVKIGETAVKELGAKSIELLPARRQLPDDVFRELLSAVLTAGMSRTAIRQEAKKRITEHTKRNPDSVTMLVEIHDPTNVSMFDDLDLTKLADMLAEFLDSEVSVRFK